VDEQDRTTLTRAQRILIWLADGRPDEDFTAQELATRAGFDALVLRFAAAELRAAGQDDEDNEGTDGE